MRLSEIVKELDLKVIYDGGDLEREITGGYASDLMSDAIARAGAGEIWVTLQIHLNVVAIGSMKDLGAILLTLGRNLNSDALTKAKEEGLAIVSSDRGAFEIIGRLYELGIRGT